MMAAGLTLVGLLMVAVIAANAWVIGFSKPYVYDHLKWVPKRKVALVLGTSPYTSSGAENLLFNYRIKAAAQLLQAGKVEHLLLSGSNPSQYYNEPQLMYKALEHHGVSGSDMTMDFAGLRTLDSVVRANKVFCLESYTVVSQRFHNFRAVFIARHRGIDAVAYSWPHEDAQQPFFTEAREFLARVVAALDVLVLHSRPKYLGEPQPIAVATEGEQPSQNACGRASERQSSEKP